MRVRTALTALTLCTAAVLAGCGGDTKIDAGAGTTTPQATTATTTAPKAEVTKCLETGQPKPAAKKQYAKGPRTLVWTSSEGGERSAAIFYAEVSTARIL